MKTSEIRTNMYYKYVASSQGTSWREDSLGGKSTTKSDGEIPKIIPPSRYTATM